jgi:hypothetical protein
MFTFDKAIKWKKYLLVLDWQEGIKCVRFMYKGYCSTQKLW